MPIKAGYWTDLSTVTLTDGEVPSCWIQAMPLGDYEHPVFGTISITPERVATFADNVNNGARGQELDIDFDHKDKSGEAAGWVKRAEARDNGLWLFIEWTKTAAAKIKEKAYKYFSPEFVDEWTHPKTQQTFKDVLFGGGITNRPFLKDILPINMSELLEEPKKKHTGGTGMDPKKLRELLGLPEDATDENVESVIKKFKETPAPPTPPVNDPLKQLAETNPMIKQLMEAQAETAKQLAETQAALRLSEISSTVAKLSEGKKHALPAVVLNELPTALAQMPKTLSDTVVTLLGKVVETGLVPLGEIGVAGKTDGEPASAVKAFTDAIAKHMADDKLSYSEAVSLVSRTQPQLFAEYRQASFAGRDN